MLGSKNIFVKQFQTINLDVIIQIVEIHEKFAEVADGFTMDPKDYLEKSYLSKRAK